MTTGDSTGRPPVSTGEIDVGVRVRKETCRWSSEKDLGSDADGKGRNFGRYRGYRGSGRRGVDSGLSGTERVRRRCDWR